LAVRAGDQRKCTADRERRVNPSFASLLTQFTVLICTSRMPIQ
jgi:hypothetical protein